MCIQITYHTCFFLYNSDWPASYPNMVGHTFEANISWHVGHVEHVMADQEKAATQHRFVYKINCGVLYLFSSSVLFSGLEFEVA